MKNKKRQAVCPECRCKHLAAFRGDTDPVADEEFPRHCVALCPGCTNELVLTTYLRTPERWDVHTGFEPSDN